VTVAAGAVAGRKRVRGAGLDRALPYLLIAPALLLILAVIVYPIAYGVRQSFLNFRFGRAVADIGFDNYRQLWSDPDFRDSLWVTIKFVLIAVPIETVLGLGLALLVAKELPFTRTARLVLIVPMIITPIVVGIVFRLIYASDVGLLTTLSKDVFGAGPVFVLDKGWSAFLGLVALDVWEWTALMFLILLAGIQSLPVEPFEAARVDGAGELRIFGSMIFPLLTPTLAVIGTTLVIFALKAFDIVYVMTSGNYDTNVLALFMYQQLFNARDLGRASAVAVILLAAVIPVLVVNVSRFRFQESVR
jgi:multiple sugar transport system permease protein